MPSNQYAGGLIGYQKSTLDTVENAIYGGVEGAGFYNEGDVAMVKAVPAEGYVFVKWNDDVLTAERSITVTDDISLVATFKKAASDSEAGSGNSGGSGSTGGSGSDTGGGSDTGSGEDYYE